MKQCKLTLAVLAACLSVSACGSQIPVSNGKPIIVPAEKPKKMVRASFEQQTYAVKKAVSENTQRRLIRTQYQPKAAHIAHSSYRSNTYNNRSRTRMNSYGAQGSIYFPKLSAHEIGSIGHQIFLNESGGSKDKLVHWNRNEEFASLGIGHWTWYPRGKSGRYGNSFPSLLQFMEGNGVRLPGWLKRAKTQGAPWKTRAELHQHRHSFEVKQLKDLLYRHRDLQTKFILQRAQKSIPRLIKSAPSSQRNRVAHNIRSLLKTPAGRYAFIDYINFKGEGFNNNGGYRGHNWGALQVLLAMNSQGNRGQATHAFADAAMNVLKRRVRNSPAHRQEHKWIPGWNRRVNTYRYFRV